MVWQGDVKQSGWGPLKIPVSVQQAVRPSKCRHANYVGLYMFFMRIFLSAMCNLHKSLYYVLFIV